MFGVIFGGNRVVRIVSDIPGTSIVCLLEWGYWLACGLFRPKSMPPSLRSMNRLWASSAREFYSGFFCVCETELDGNRTILRHEMK
jgi:hypothetical protein